MFYYRFCKIGKCPKTRGNSVRFSEKCLMFKRKEKTILTMFNKVLMESILGSLMGSLLKRV